MELSIFEAGMIAHLSIVCARKRRKWQQKQWFSRPAPEGGREWWGWGLDVVPGSRWLPV